MYAYFQTIGIGCCIQSEMFCFSLIYVDTEFLGEKQNVLDCIHVCLYIFRMKNYM